MEEILKQILDKMNGMESRMENGFSNLKERIEMNGRANKEEFRQLNKKIDTLTDAVVKTMEDINGLKSTVEKQDVEIRVIKGGKHRKTQ